MEISSTPNFQQIRKIHGAVEIFKCPNDKKGLHLLGTGKGIFMLLPDNNSIEGLLKGKPQNERDFTQIRIDSCTHTACQQCFDLAEKSDLVYKCAGCPLTGETLVERKMPLLQKFQESLCFISHANELKLNGMQTTYYLAVIGKVVDEHTSSKIVTTDPVIKRELQNLDKDDYKNLAQALKSTSGDSEKAQPRSYETFLLFCQLRQLTWKGVITHVEDSKEMGDAKKTSFLGALKRTIWKLGQQEHVAKENQKIEDSLRTCMTLQQALTKPPEDAVIPAVTKVFPRRALETFGFVLVEIDKVDREQFSSSSSMQLMEKISFFFKCCQKVKIPWQRILEKLDYKGQVADFMEVLRKHYAESNS